MAKKIKVILAVMLLVFSVFSLSFQTSYADPSDFEDPDTVEPYTP